DYDLYRYRKDREAGTASPAAAGATGTAGARTGGKTEVPEGKARRQQGARERARLRERRDAGRRGGGGPGRPPRGARAAGGAAARPSPAPDLPAVGVKRLVASAIRAASRHRPISGTATTHVDLGLPDVPSTEGGPGTGPLAVLSGFSGDHTLRVWASRDGLRV